MLHDYRIILVGLALAINVVSFFPYIRDILRGTTKPHPFTWFIWSLINIIAFFAQFSAGGGIGVLVTVSTVFGCSTITILSLSRGEKSVPLIDWFSLAGAIAGVILWRVTHDPLAAVVFVVIADALAGIPTLRKAYWKPYEETALAYTLGMLGFVFGIPAFESLNLTTVLYPAFIILFNGFLVGMLLLRRRQLGRVR